MEDGHNVDYEVPLYIALLQLYKLYIILGFKTQSEHIHKLAFCMSFNSYERIQFVTDFLTIFKRKIWFLKSIAISSCKQSPMALLFFM